MDYKLIKRQNPRDRDQEPKWYAIPLTGEAESTKVVTRSATANTSTAPIEMEAAITHYSNYILEKLRKGESVEFGSFGSFRVTFNSKGVENIDDFDPNSMISNPRIRFIPSKEFRNAFKSGLTYRNAGVRDGQVDYLSIKAYRIAKGIDPDSGTGSKPGGSDGDDSDAPLGRK